MYIIAIRYAYVLLTPWNKYILWALGMCPAWYLEINYLGWSHFSWWHGSFCILFLQGLKKELPIWQKEGKITTFEGIYQLKCEGMTILLMHSSLQIKATFFCLTIMFLIAFVFLAWKKMNWPPVPFIHKEQHLQYLSANYVVGFEW